MDISSFSFYLIVVLTCLALSSYYLLITEMDLLFISQLYLMLMILYIGSNTIVGPGSVLLLVILALGTTLYIMTVSKFPHTDVVQMGIVVELILLILFSQTNSKDTHQDIPTTLLLTIYGVFLLYMFYVVSTR